MVQANSQHSNYIKDQIQSATPQKLVVMLYDKAIRCLEDAKKEIENKDQFPFSSNIVRAEQIIAELMGALKADIAP